MSSISSSWQDRGCAVAKFFTVQSTKLSVDRAKRRINGAAIATVGDANGDTIDQQTLQMLAALGAPGGIRARFDHPNRANPAEVEQTLSNLLGEWTNFRVDGEVCRADCQLAGVNVEKEDTVLDLAEKAPHLFGTSIVFDDTPLPKGQKPKRGTPCRPVKLYAADFVDIPAANNAGLFAARSNEESSMKTPMCARDGKLYCNIEGKEYELESNPEAYACHKAMAKAAKEEHEGEGEGEGEEAEREAAKKKAAEKTQQEATVPEQIDVEKVKAEAVTAERTRRKMFSTILSTANVTRKEDIAELEQFYEDGMDEKQLKFLASRTIGARARAVGDGSGEPERKEQTPEQTELAKVEKAASDRFDEELSVRRMFGVTTADKESDAYKTARGRYVAAQRKQHLSAAK